MQRRALRPLLLLAAAAVLLAACSGEASPFQTTVTSTRPPSSTTSLAEPTDLRSQLIPEPTSGGPWSQREDNGSPIDVLDPVCDVGYPDNRPLSAEHVGQLFIGGTSYPMVVQMIDRFATDDDAAAVVDMHRQAVGACTTWSRQDSDGLSEFSVRTLPVPYPGDGVAFEVTASKNGETLVTQQVIFRTGQVITFLGYAATAIPDTQMLGELIALVSPAG